MREEDNLLINIHNLLTISSFVIEQSEKNLDVLRDTLSACKAGKIEFVNKCVFQKICDVIDLMILLEEIDKFLINSSISPECKMNNPALITPSVR